jgi:hypothetical protein
MGWVLGAFVAAGFLFFIGAFGVWDMDDSWNIESS